MKKIILFALLLMLLTACNHKPEFYIDGKPFYTRQSCVDHYCEDEWGYHYDFNPLTGKFEYFYGIQEECRCIEVKIDTIAIDVE